MKKFVKKLMKNVGFEVTRISSGLPKKEISKFRKGGCVPWSPGYNQAKWQFIVETLSDASVVASFENGARLPERFGVGFDERCVEYPWVLSRLKGGPEQLLDAGSTLNYRALVDCPILHGKMLHILTLAPEGNCFWEKGISYLYGDLRNIPIRDSFYGSVICISTLEHVGCDNRLYTGGVVVDSERGEDEFLVAIREMRRILMTGGSLYLTVPYGHYRNYSAFQQFDRRLLACAIDAFGPASSVEQAFYRYTADGWNISQQSDCDRCEYVHWLAAAWQGQPWPKPLRVEPDRAAAARAVACVQLIKK